MVILRCECRQSDTRAHTHITLQTFLALTSRSGMDLYVHRREVIIFNKNVQFFFSVGYSVVAINHIVEFKEKKQVNTISEVNDNNQFL